MSTDSVDQDSEADAFAMELLMPEAMVRERVRPPLTQQGVEQLAADFEVPIVAMTLRLVSLGLVSVAASGPRSSRGSHRDRTRSPSRSPRR
jgi:Zn-dependent peptidase ImmA (M78 family)